MSTDTMDDVLEKHEIPEPLRREDGLHSEVYVHGNAVSVLDEGLEKDVHGHGTEPFVFAPASFPSLPLSITASLDTELGKGLENEEDKNAREILTGSAKLKTADVKADATDNQNSLTGLVQPLDERHTDTPERGGKAEQGAPPRVDSAKEKRLLSTLTKDAYAYVKGLRDNVEMTFSTAAVDVSQVLGTGASPGAPIVALPRRQQVLTA